MISEKWFKSNNIRVRTPTGSIYVNLVDDERGKLIHITVNAGKAGSDVSIWVDGMCSALNMGLEKGAFDVYDCMQILFGYNGSGSSTLNKGNVMIRSVQQGIVHALQQYSNEKLPKLAWSPRMVR